MKGAPNKRFTSRLKILKFKFGVLPVEFYLISRNIEAVQVHFVVQRSFVAVFAEVLVGLALVWSAMFDHSCP